MGLLGSLLGSLSGNSNLKISEQLLFDKVIGFRSIVPGCGASTVLQNVAIALSETTKFNICVLDTNFMYPIQYPLLASTELKEGDPDVLDFSGDLSKTTRGTTYPNVYIVQLENRSVIDMLSGKDTESGITKLMSNLKSYFDIILVDLSYELTNTAIYSAIKCNKIIMVADTSLKCLYYIKKSINTMVTLGIPLAKCNKVIVNKDLPNVVLGVDNALQDAGLEIIGHIPLSMDIAVSCATGKRIYGALSREAGISAFNVCVENLIDNVIEKSPLNAEYMDVAKELQRLEEMQRAEEVANNNDEFIEEGEGGAESYTIDELEVYDEEGSEGYQDGYDGYAEEEVYDE